MTDSERPPTARRRERSRPFDIVLWGATGYTGHLVAEYLLVHSVGSDLRWALAGRSRDKLVALRRQLEQVRPDAAELPLLTGDSRDPASLEALAEQAEVVCSTVGPYAKYGSELVAACVGRGTDYCDITGEVAWVRSMIEALHDEARTSGARIVSFCGFDSIPSDLGCLMLQEHARAEHGAGCDQITLYAGESRGGFSGGTIDSMTHRAKLSRHSAELRYVLADPYSLNPVGERRGPDGSDERAVRFDADIGRWTGPFLMASINTRVVRRSNALMGYAYGRDFRYRELASYPAGTKGLARAVATTVAVGTFTAALARTPTRRLLARTVLPSPGEGPSQVERERGFFRMRLRGTGHGADGEPFAVSGLVEGTSDPGYGETSKMLAESALCLALDGASLDSPGGLLTPASAMGMRLVERLRAAGMTFEVT